MCECVCIVGKHTHIHYFACECVALCVAGRGGVCRGRNQHGLSCRAYAKQNAHLVGEHGVKPAKRFTNASQTHSLAIHSAKRNNTPQLHRVCVACVV